MEDPPFAVEDLPIDVATFRALARSAPWRWRTVRMTVHWLPGEPVRAWVRRSGGSRVETLGGDLLQADADPPGPARATLFTQSTGGTGGSPPTVPAPRLGPDRLVREPRPSWEWYDHDAPMYQNYSWVAMLDPRELADGSHRHAGGEDRGVADAASVPGTDVLAVAAAVHHGRSALEAVLRPTAAYDPRCGCCALLPNPLTHADEWGDARGRLDDDYVFPDAFRVRLDTATGILVRLDQLGGSGPARHLEARIEAVDDIMPDELFVDPRLSRRVTRVRTAVARRRDRLLGRGVPGRWSPYLD